VPFSKSFARLRDDYLALALERLPISRDRRLLYFEGVVVESDIGS
jgi:hypothetical protein